MLPQARTRGDWKTVLKLIRSRGFKPLCNRRIRLLLLLLKNQIHEGALGMRGGDRVVRHYTPTNGRTGKRRRRREPGQKRKFTLSHYSKRVFLPRLLPFCRDDLMHFVKKLLLLGGFSWCLRDDMGDDVASLRRCPAVLKNRCSSRLDRLSQASWGIHGSMRRRLNEEGFLGGEQRIATIFMDLMCKEFDDFIYFL